MIVVTFATLNGNRLNLTSAQIDALHQLGEWPRDDHGEPFRRSLGMHEGQPDYSDEDFREEFGYV